MEPNRVLPRHARRISSSPCAASSILYCALSLGAALGGCGSRKPSPGADAVTEAPSVPELLKSPYERGRWRLLGIDERDRVVLWLSHILIRHEASNANDRAFRTVGWLPDGSPPKRTRAAALELARELAGQLKKEPERFEQLARKHSEDVSTRDRGGRLGGSRAGQLGSSFIDAWRALAWDATSEVLETSHGFHILRKHRPPAEEQVAGEHLVLRYAGTIGFEVLGASTRSRDEALKLAREIASSARPFPELILEHSEVEDRIRGGDMGVWSTIAPEYNGPQVDVLSRLEIGEISAPLDTAQGIELIRRVAPTERVIFAATLIQLPYDPNTPGSSPGSREAVGREAQVLADQVQADSNAFERLRDSHCCNEVLQWIQGKGSPALEAALARLEIDSVAPKPIDIGWFYVIPKRLAPTIEPEPPVLYDVPNPESADLEGLLRHSDGSALSAGVQAMSSAIQAEASFPPAARNQLDRTLAELALALEHAETPDQRVEADRLAREELRVQLSTPDWQKFLAFSQTWLANEIMKLTP